MWRGVSLNLFVNSESEHYNVVNTALLTIKSFTRKMTSVSGNQNTQFFDSVIPWATMLFHTNMLLATSKPMRVLVRDATIWSCLTHTCHRLVNCQRIRIVGKSHWVLVRSTCTAAMELSVSSVFHANMLLLIRSPLSTNAKSKRSAKRSSKIRLIIWWRTCAQQ